MKCGNYKNLKFTLTFFGQKYRQSNAFMKAQEITKELIWIDEKNWKEQKFRQSNAITKAAQEITKELIWGQIWKEQKFRQSNAFTDARAQEITKELIWRKKLLRVKISSNQLCTTLISSLLKTHYAPDFFKIGR